MKPRRAVVFEASIHADTVPDLLAAITELLLELELKGQVDCTFGGNSSGGRLVADIDPTITHEAYVDALIASIAPAE